MDNWGCLVDPSTYLTIDMTYVEQGVNEQGVLTGLLLQGDSKAEFIYVPPLHEKPNVFNLDTNYGEYALQYSCKNIAHIVECSNLQLYTVIKLNFASTLLSISFLSLNIWTYWNILDSFLKLFEVWYPPPQVWTAILDLMNHRVSPPIPSI